MFDIFAQLGKELHEFNNQKVFIAGVGNQEGARYLAENSKGYEFSQKKTLNLIDLYYNSKFESGDIDSEGQRKVFLNICQFRADVAAKQVDLDVKDFTFVPEESASVWGAYFMNRRFKEWAKESYFGELINQCVADFPKYGTVVLKRVGMELERVPLKTLSNQQDAKSLKTASFVIETHKDMTLAEMKAMKGWEVSELDLDFDEKATVYERYGKVPLTFYKEYKGLEVLEEDDDEAIDVMCVMTLTKKEEAKDDYTGSILFLEDCTDNRPYEEVHWKRIDGRWLGLGEVENQFENQVTRNMLANLRRRALLWSSKKIFQSTDPELAKNLIRSVKDGDVMKISGNGNITQVDMASRSFPEFQSTEEVWEKNSDQKSFTYEVATGESLPSGTPFRLGVVMSNAVNSHFAMKREILGLFFNRVIDNLVYPIFKKENQWEHTVALFADEEGIQDLKQILIKNHIAETAKEQLLNGILPDIEAISQKVTDEITARRTLFMNIPDKFYDDVKAKVQLVITGEQIDIPKRLETLTNVLAGLQPGDPLRERIMGKILALTGENYDALTGMQKPQAPQPQPGAGGSMPAVPPSNPQQAMAGALS